MFLEPVAQCEPGRLWSLWDMINYQLMPLIMLLKALQEEQTTFEDKIRVRDLFSVVEKVNPGQASPPSRTVAVELNDINRIRATLELARNVVSTMLLPSADNRLPRFEAFITRQPPFKLEDVLAEVKALRDAIEDDCRFKRLHLYRPDVSLLVSRAQSDWNPAYQAFPAIQKDIETASDCYALGHYTSCVFHLMRVAEIGLRAIAKERKVTLKKDKLIEWAEWGEILKAIEDERDKIQFGAKAGPNKDRALAFYSGALAHLAAFKDQYRNLVSHVRKDYEEWEAQIALNHVRDFMNGLPPLVTAETKRPINWKF